MPITTITRLAFCSLALLLATAAHADQYKSETRELESVPQAKAATGQTLQEQLKTTSDPYARAMILRELAYDAANKKDYKAAAAYVDQALKAGGLSGIAAEQLKKELPQMLMASGEPKTILAQLEKQVKEGTATPEVQVAVAAQYLEKKRYSEAIPLLKNGIAKTSNPDPSWKAALLKAYLATGHEAEALPLLQEQLRLSPQLRENWLRVAAMALKSGEKERATATLELAARQGHLKTAEERLQLITLTAQIGAPFEAGSAMQRWMTESAIPRTALNWQTLGALWVRAREAGLAVTALQEAERLSPSAQTLLQIGQLQMDRAQYAQAAESLNKAINAGAKSGPALMTLGMAYYQQANVDAAVNAFKQAQQFAASKKLASDWVKYLESGAAREQALAAAARAKPTQTEEARISSKLGGSQLSIEGAAPARDLPQVALAASSTAGSGGRALTTQVGAEQGGNADGRIPAWTGGLTAAPASYVPGKRLTDPFPQDRPLFTISAANLKQYAGNLSRGHQALFAKYPDYQMPVYQTRRSAAYPQAIYDATAANAGKARLEGSDALVGARLGFPFKKPQNGVEVLWNHRTRYRGDTVQAIYSQAIVRAGDAPRYAKQDFKLYFRYGNIKDPVDIAKQNILVYGITSVADKGLSADFVALFHETANSITKPRSIWVLIVKLGRMLRIPPIGYDQPFPASDALEFIDMVDMYNGAFDRYVWKLTGKRELFIPYNSYRLSDGSQKYAQLLTAGHINPANARYELHRVWVIEATERGGQHHVFGKRTFYVDEDSWNVVLVENEDHEGKLWRFQEAHLAQLYDIVATNAAPTFTFDLKDGRYFANRLFAEDLPFQYNLPMRDNNFDPAAVKAQYSR